MSERRGFVARQEAPAPLPPQVLTLPYPPSANALWRAVAGRNIASTAYRSWKREALTLLMLQRPRTVVGPYRLTIVATRPDRRRRDLGNIEKACSDLLQAGGVINDDCDATSIWLRWSDSAPDKSAGVRVTVEAAA